MTTETVINQILRVAEPPKGSASIGAILDRIVECAPGLIARTLDRVYGRAAKTWEIGDNSGNGTDYNRGVAQCAVMRDAASGVLAHWGVEVDFPGLYPTFRWNGRCYHSALELLQDIGRRNGG